MFKVERSLKKELRPLNKILEFSDKDDDVYFNNASVDVIENISALEDNSFLTGNKKIEKKGPLIIPLLRENVWRGKDGQEKETTAKSLVADSSTPPPPPPVKKRELESSNEEEQPDESTKKKKFGLILPKKRRKQEHSISEQPKVFDQADSNLDVAVEMTEDERAIAALMAEANNESVVKESEVQAIPLMAVNKIPGIDGLPDETAKYRYDVSLRPEEATLEDYERIPIESFGKAMLLGMGWTENDKRFPKAHVAQSRPHLAGLGANVSEMPGPSRKSNGLNSKPAGKKDGDRETQNESKTKGSFQVGQYVRITSGEYKGESGEILSVKESRDGIYVKVLLSNNETVKVWDDCILVEKKSTEDSVETSWLRPHLRVKIVDKKFERGAFYLKKCVIQDVISGKTCVAKSDDGRLAEDLRQSQVQTCIPSENGKVVVVVGAHKGEIGTLLEKDKKKEKAVVQLDSSMEAHIFNFDDICEILELMQ